MPHMISLDPILKEIGIILDVVADPLLRIDQSRVLLTVYVYPLVEDIRMNHEPLVAYTRVLMVTRSVGVMSSTLARLQKQ